MTTLFTVGHSTRSLDELAQILVGHHVQRVVDVRTYPASRRYPWFNRFDLHRALRDTYGIEYTHLVDLGGRRRKQRVDPRLNDAWRNASFRNYADYMQSEDFERGIETLLALGERSRVAYMCSEAVPWRCHRRLISDTLVARGHQVWHLTGPDAMFEHELGLYQPTPHVMCGTVTYPKDPAQLLLPGLVLSELLPVGQ